MGRIPTQLIGLLEAAVEAGRKALADMDADEIPARLRKVAMSSARSLPPPLARSVLDAISDDAGFRERVADEIGDDASLSKAFVTRSQGWWVEVAQALAEETTREATAALEEARADVERLEQYATEADTRVKKSQDAVAAAHAEARGRVDEARARVRELAGEGSDVARLEEQIEALEGRLSEAAASLVEANTFVAAHRERIRRLRRSRPTITGAESRSLPSDPLELARALDHQVELVARLDGAAPETRAPGEARPDFSLPRGMSPDSPDALRWLQAAPAATVVIDGYNVLFRLEGNASATGSARQRLGDAARRLHLQSVNRHAVIVVFDSSLEGDRPKPMRSGGVDVRFAQADALADEEIVELAHTLPGRIVVVSSDREVRENASAAGAITLWSEVLLPLLRG